MQKRNKITSKNFMNIFLLKLYSSKVNAMIPESYNSYSYNTCEYFILLLIIYQRKNSIEIFA